MKKLMFVLFAFALLASTVSLAQDAAKPETVPVVAPAQLTPTAAAQPITVTGCLQKGTQPSEVTITGADAKIYDLRSDSVKLDQHIGQQVTVTGTDSSQAKAEEKKEGQVENASSKEAYGNLSVTDLKMVSETCTK
jgi:Skp family chaperone for outer membrane proteins